MPDRSKVMTQIKKDNQALHVGDWTWGWKPPPNKKTFCLESSKIGMRTILEGAKIRLELKEEDKRLYTLKTKLRFTSIQVSIQTWYLQVWDNTTPPFSLNAQRFPF